MRELYIGKNFGTVKDNVKEAIAIASRGQKVCIIVPSHKQIDSVEELVIRFGGKDLLGIHIYVSALYTTKVPNYKYQVQVRANDLDFGDTKENGPKVKPITTLSKGVTLARKTTSSDESFHKWIYEVMLDTPSPATVHLMDGDFLNEMIETYFETTTMYEATVRCKNRLLWLICPHNTLMWDKDIEELYRKR